MMYNCKGSIWIIFFWFLFCLWVCGCFDDVGMFVFLVGVDWVMVCVWFLVWVVGEIIWVVVQVDVMVEEKIFFVVVFLVLVDGSGKEDWNDVQYEVVYGMISSVVDVYQVCILIIFGEKKVYVGVNLLFGQVYVICGQVEGKGLYIVIGVGYDEVIWQFVCGMEGIVMIGKVGIFVMVSVGIDVNVDFMVLFIILEWVVVKVLLVCDIYIDDGGVYVWMFGNVVCLLVDLGWICLLDVWYVFNIVNWKVYLNVFLDGKDFNYEVDLYVVKDDGGNYVLVFDVVEQ